VKFITSHKSQGSKVAIKAGVKTMHASHSITGVMLTTAKGFKHAIFNFISPKLNQCSPDWTER
jgi:hypothetical protein